MLPLVHSIFIYERWSLIVRRSHFPYLRSENYDGNQLQQVQSSVGCVFESTHPDLHRALFILLLVRAHYHILGVSSSSIALQLKIPNCNTTISNMVFILTKPPNFGWSTCRTL